MNTSLSLYVLFTALYINACLTLSSAIEAGDQENSEFGGNIEIIPTIKPSTNVSIKCSSYSKINTKKAIINK